MTISQTNTPSHEQNTPEKAANRPAFDAVIPVTSENSETTWQKIGAAWASKGGFNLVLTALPFTPDGKQAIYLRPRQGKAVTTHATQTE